MSAIAGGDMVAGGMLAAQTRMLSSILHSSQEQSAALMESMLSVNLQNRFVGEKMAVAAEIINAYGGSIDITA